MEETYNSGIVKGSTPAKMCGNVKMHKICNPTRVITSGCNTAIENLSIFGPFLIKNRKCALWYFK